MFQKVKSDIRSAHVRGCTERSLPIASTPIPSGIEQGGFELKEIPDTLKIAVRSANEFANEFRWELGLLVHGYKILSLKRVPANDFLMSCIEMDNARRFSETNMGV